MLLVHSLERVEYMVDTQVPHHVHADAPVLPVADRHEFLQPLGWLLRNAVIVVLRVRIGISRQRGRQRHTAVVEDLDSGELQPAVPKPDDTPLPEMTTSHAEMSAGGSQTSAKSCISGESDLLKRPDVPSFRRSLHYACDPEAVQDSLRDLEL